MTDTVTTVEQTRDQETARLMIKLRADLVSGIRKLTPESMTLLARQVFHEAESDHQAAAMLHGGVQAVMRALAEHAESITAANKAESARLAPVVAEAARRSFEIVRKLESIANRARFIDARPDERRSVLLAAGVKPDEIERIVFQVAVARKTIRTELDAERAVLSDELKALGQFLRTRNEDHLPEGFAVSDAPPRISGRDAAHKHAVA